MYLDEIFRLLAMTFGRCSLPFAVYHLPIVFLPFAVYQLPSVCLPYASCLSIYFHLSMDSLFYRDVNFFSDSSDHTDKFCLPCANSIVNGDAIQEDGPQEARCPICRDWITMVQRVH